MCQHPIVMTRAVAPSVWGKKDECGPQTLIAGMDRSADQIVLRGHIDSSPRV